MFIINLSHSVTELTIYKNSTYFMSLFALVHTPKKCKQQCEYLHYSFALAHEVLTIFCTPILCANGNPIFNAVETGSFFLLNKWLVKILLDTLLLYIGHNCGG